MISEDLVIQNLGPLRDVHIQIKPMTLLLGKTGAGKSLTLKVLAMMRHICKMTIVRHALKVSGVKKKSSFRLREDSYLKFANLQELVSDKTKIVYTLHWENATSCTIRFPNITRPNFAPKNAIGPFMKLAFLADSRNLVASWERKGASLQSRILDNYFAETYELWDQALADLPESGLHLDYLCLALEAAHNNDGHREVALVDSAQRSRTRFVQSASGQRASIPIAICLHWLLNRYNFDEDISRHYVTEILADFMARKAPLKSLSTQKLAKFAKRFLAIHIEEPELGLDPNTQIDLLENLVSAIDNRRTTAEVSVAFTTHSPYWVAALNTLLQEKRHDFLAPGRVAGYLIQDGISKNLFDPETNLLIAQNLDDATSSLDIRFDNALTPNATEEARE